MRFRLEVKNLARHGRGERDHGVPRRGADDDFAGAFARRVGGNDRPVSSGGDRYEDRDRHDDRRRDDGPPSNAFNSLRVSDDHRQAAAPVNEEQDKKAKAQKLREERKKTAEEERRAVEEAKRKAIEEKKAKEAALAQKAEGDRAIMGEVLGSGKLGDELVKVAKAAFATSGRPSGAVVIETVTKKAEAAAKGSANFIAPTQYGGLLKLALADAAVADQVQALEALQVFLNGHDFPKGVLEKCFMALYTLDIVEEKAFLDYKCDVDSDVAGRMKAIVQTSNWLTWLETPEDESEEEDE